MNSIGKEAAILFCVMLTLPIGELWSPRRIIRLHAGPEGTLYTVCSPDGTVLGAQLTGDELTRAFPDIDLPMLCEQADGYQLMMVDPD